MKQMVQAQSGDEDNEDAFWRKLILPEEEHLRMGKPWTGSCRWFRSPNVVPIEQWRKIRDGEKRAPPPKETRDDQI
jgi:hypothetical protein